MTNVPNSTCDVPYNSGTLLTVGCGYIEHADKMIKWYGDAQSIVKNKLNRANVVEQQASLMYQWWSNFINPVSYFDINDNSILTPDYLKKGFANKCCSILSETRNHKTFKKTRSIENKPFCMSQRTTMAHHMYLVQDVVYQKLGIELLIPYEFVVGLTSKNRQCIAVANWDNTFMVVPYFTDIVLMGIDKTDPSILVFMSKDGNYVRYSKSFNPSRSEQ